jgi:hypothetical protein
MVNYELKGFNKEAVSVYLKIMPQRLPGGFRGRKTQSGRPILGPTIEPEAFGKRETKN